MIANCTRLQLNPLFTLVNDVLLDTTVLNHLVKVVGPALMVGIAQGTSPPAQHFGDFLHLMTTDQLAFDNVLLTTVVHIEMLAASTKTKDIWRVGVLEIALVSFVDNVNVVIQKHSFLQSVERTTTAKIIGSGQSFCYIVLRIASSFFESLQSEVMSGGFYHGPEREQLSVI